MNKEELDKTIATLNEGVDIIQRSLEGDAEAWPAVTGLPSETITKLLEWAFEKNVSPEELLMVAATLGFAWGKKVSQTEATNSKAATSESA